MKKKQARQPAESNDAAIARQEKVSEKWVQHTPGPWQCINGYIAGMGENNATIAKMTDIKATHANARLIAAAPETAAERDSLRCDNGRNRQGRREGVLTREVRATSRTHVKDLALRYARDTRHHPFTRVSAGFLDCIEAATMRLIRLRVDGNPSKGVTLT